MLAFRAVLTALLCLSLSAQTTPDANQRLRAVKDLAKSGSDSIPRLQPYLADPVVEVRVEAVKALVEIGTSRSLDPLIAATRDNDPEIQIRATDGLVNFYLPGYARSSGFSSSLKRAGSVIRAKFVEPPDQAIDPFIPVRPDVIESLARLLREGSSIESRSAAARALGVLRGQSALDDLAQALRSRQDPLIYESLIAIQKIRDPAAGPRVTFLLRDFNDRIQLAAIETTGLLRNQDASADLRDVVDHGRNNKARRAALSALAMLGQESDRTTFARYFADRDDGMRAAAAEGFARLKSPADLKMLENAFETEKKMNARLSLAFAAVAAGRNDLTEFSPLQYLVNTLNLNAWRGVALAFLVELARDPGVRRTLYGALRTATKDEKISLGQVIAASGDAEAVGHLERLAADPDVDVAREGLRALKSLKARL